MSSFNQQNRFIFLQRRPQSLLSQIIAFVVGIIVLAVSFVFGAFLLTAFFGLLLLVVLIAMVRGWWLRRQMASFDGASDNGTRGKSHEVIDGDYTVIDSGHKRRDNDPS
jgi:membrane protein implicated in regulation of membrane protease activity